MAKMNRMLQLKRIVAIDGQRFPAISPLNTHTAMKAVFAAATTIGDRHFPAPAKVSAGKRCIFFEHTQRKGKATLFHAYIYTSGHTPDQVVPDFTAASANITAQPIKNANGKQVEVVHRVGCMVLGDAIIIESARVFGASQLIIAAMRDLIRRHYNKSYPSLSLQDAPNRDFKKLAKAHGGTKKVTARLNGDFTPEPKSFGFSLDKIFEQRKLSKFKKISASIEAEEGKSLNPDVVLSLVDESEGSTGLTGITVEFHDGTTLSELDEYRERYRAEVTEIRAGVPDFLEIETAIVDYMKQLATANDETIRIIDPNGIFVT